MEREKSHRSSVTFPERISRLLTLTVSSADVPVDAITVGFIQVGMEAKGGERKWSWAKFVFQTRSRPKRLKRCDWSQRLVTGTLQSQQQQFKHKLSNETNWTRGTGWTLRYETVETGRDTEPGSNTPEDNWTREGNQGSDRQTFVFIRLLSLIFPSQLVNLINPQLLINLRQHFNIWQPY